MTELLGLQGEEVGEEGGDLLVEMLTGDDDDPLGDSGLLVC